jgi:hypothetical protein
VLVQTAAADAADFPTQRAVDRSAIDVIGSYHGLIEGGSYNFSGLADESATAAFAWSGAAGSDEGLVRACIDGEMLQGRGGASSTPPLQHVFADTLNNPFSAAPANNDRPYYMYLCGGRGFPIMSMSGGAALGITDVSPWIIIESLTPPDENGRPGAAIAASIGAPPQSACLYVGVGWTVQGTTFRKPVRGDADGWVWAMGSSSGTTPSPDRLAIFQETDAAAGALRTPPAALGTTNFDLLTAPFVPHRFTTREAILKVDIQTFFDESFKLESQGPETTWYFWRSAGAATAGVYRGDIRVQLPGSTPPTPPDMNISRGAAGGGVSFVMIAARAYRTNVRRLSMNH